MTRIRYQYINSEILKLLKSLPDNLLCFPLDIKKIIQLIPNCNLSSYSYFANHYNVSINDVISLCNSQSGCTHYDEAKNKYLILYNNSSKNYNVRGRQIWTLAHELGHVKLKHLLYLSEKMVAENRLDNSSCTIFEQEADYFAATILCPFQIYKHLKITEPLDIQNIFDLSISASENRFEQYEKWKTHHVKTAFDNDLVKIFKPFLNDYKLRSQ
ncbi:ImmA/IrrE family metallo-endopeptidase [Anaerovorax sp. IOR16]|uniref:ImmA/IrrE family metallo-endopeptidase n=1 Tax=Anaerovorax sp. IOR16 TaxID=2773458 RepID=UPI0019D13EF9|nr:ImmA/IrrE family metallo-endopeptidase [Anaerovorax sp. IOR16]